MGKLLSSASLENEYIKMALHNDFSFVKQIDEYDFSVIFNDVKKMNYQEDVIDALFRAFQNENSSWAFHLVYKIEKYKDFIFSYISSLEFPTWATQQSIQKLIYYPWFYSYLKEHLDTILELGEEVLNTFFQCAFEIGDFNTVSSLVTSNNIEIRSSCLSYVFHTTLRMHINKIYPGVLTDYFVIKGKDGKIMEKITEEVLSACATNLFDYIFCEDLYQVFMQFILDNYEDNHLLTYLLQDYKEDNFDHRKEFLEKNIFSLYDSSCGAQLDIYYSFSYLLDEKRTLEIEQFLKMVEPGHRDFIYEAFSKGLGNKILTYFHKYYSLCHSSEVKTLELGSCCIAYQIGSYVLKISNHKYSYEDSVCPNCISQEKVDSNLK